MTRHIYILVLIFLVGILCPHHCLSVDLSVGADQTDRYLPMLMGKRVGLYTNHTGLMSDGGYTLDMMLSQGVDVRCVFAPEHGFRGTADAGEHINSGVDQSTGVRIVSLFGSKKASNMARALDSLDVVVVDIQDVGLRYYTYYVTMLELMNGAAARSLDFVVLDRPNPNGMYVDGPILDMSLASGVGRLPIPVVHGLTLGEMAQMINGEGWLDGEANVRLTVVPCEGYTHQTRYRLPVAPSPNLASMTAVYLYPSLCYFEATDVSVGRGTDMAFCVYGHPEMSGDYDFTPQSRQGAMKPLHQGCECHGRDLSLLSDEEIIAGGINFDYVLDAYRQLKQPGKRFLGKFFDNLIGNREVRSLIARGADSAQIRASWRQDVERFKKQRQPYLLYLE